jgi:exonuclease III
MSSCSVLCWNVRGLNQVAKRAVVAEVVKSSGASFFCCQESKLAVLDQQLVAQTCGASLDGFDFVFPAMVRGVVFSRLGEVIALWSLAPTRVIGRSP